MEEVGPLGPEPCSSRRSLRQSVCAVSSGVFRLITHPPTEDGVYTGTLDVVLRISHLNTSDARDPS